MAKHTPPYVDGNTVQANRVTADWLNGVNTFVYDPMTPTLQSYTYATLPTPAVGMVAWCSNGRKAAEGAGVGTGVPVYYSSTGGWCSFRTDATVLI